MYLIYVNIYHFLYMGMNTNLRYVKSFQIWKPNSAHFSLSPNGPTINILNSEIMLKFFLRLFYYQSVMKINVVVFSARGVTTTMIQPKWITVFITKLGKHKSSWKKYAHTFFWRSVYFNRVLTYFSFLSLNVSNKLKSILKSWILRIYIEDH